MPVDYKSLVGSALRLDGIYLQPCYGFGEAYCRCQFGALTFIHRMMILIDADEPGRGYEVTTLKKEGRDRQCMWSVVNTDDWRWKELIEELNMTLSIKELQEHIIRLSHELLYEKLNTAVSAYREPTDFFGLLQPAARMKVDGVHVSYSNLFYRSTTAPPRSSLRTNIIKFIENYYLLVTVETSHNKRARALYRVQKVFYDDHWERDLYCTLIISDRQWDVEIKVNKIHGKYFTRRVKTIFEGRVKSGSLSVAA